MTMKNNKDNVSESSPPVSPAGLHCCYAVITVLTVTVTALSVALSLSVRKNEKAIASPEVGYVTCPRDWIGFGSKCFYFSEHTSNWTSSLTSCLELGAQFDSLEELNFLHRYKGDSAAWIGLHRQSSEHPWMWTDNTEYEEQQGQCLRTVSPVSPAGLHCCYAVIFVLTGAVIALSVALSLSVGKEEMGTASPEAGYVTCPRDWIGFGSKCFYFSEHTSNWTSSLTSCLELGAHLTHFDSLEELNFLNRFNGDSAAWIGLHRESSEQPWMWTDSTEYNNLYDVFPPTVFKCCDCVSCGFEGEMLSHVKRSELEREKPLCRRVSIRGDGNHAYLSDRGISSARNYMQK
ncbi:LOW QUALITY PROTEIN: hypothetical protein U0070_011390, partial [Myodes glareolus]